MVVGNGPNSISYLPHLTCILLTQLICRSTVAHSLSMVFALFLKQFSYIRPHPYKLTHSMILIFDFVSYLNNALI